MLLTLIVLVVAALFFAIGKIRSDVVALCALIVLMVSGVLTPDESSVAQYSRRVLPRWSADAS